MDFNAWGEVVPGGASGERVGGRLSGSPQFLGGDITTKDEVSKHFGASAVRWRVHPRRADLDRELERARPRLLLDRHQEAVGGGVSLAGGHDAFGKAWS